MVLLLVRKGYIPVKKYFLTSASVHGNFSLGATRGVTMVSAACLIEELHMHQSVHQQKNQSVGELCPSHFSLVIVVRPCKSTSSLQAHTSGKSSHQSLPFLTRVSKTRFQCSEHGDTLDCDMHTHVGHGFPNYDARERFSATAHHPTDAADEHTHSARRPPAILRGQLWWIPAMRRGGIALPTT